MCRIVWDCLLCGNFISFLGSMTAWQMTHSQRTQYLVNLQAINLCPTRCEKIWSFAATWLRAFVQFGDSFLQRLFVGSISLKDTKNMWVIAHMLAKDDCLLWKKWHFCALECDGLGSKSFRKPLLQHWGGETLPNRWGLSWCSHEWWNRGRSYRWPGGSCLLKWLQKLALDVLCIYMWCMAYCIGLLPLYYSIYLFIYLSICPSMYMLSFHVIERFFHHSLWRKNWM